jgi:Protein of unknown function (DUF429)
MDPPPHPPGSTQCVDRPGRASFCETYPGGAPAVWGLRAACYKKHDATGARRTIVDRFRARVDLDHVVDQLVGNDDDLDAVIEGWIHVPTISLDQVVEVRFAG